MKLFIANMRGFILMDLEGSPRPQQEDKRSESRRTRRRMSVIVAVRRGRFIQVFGVLGHSTLSAFSELDDEGAVNEELAL